MTPNDLVPERHASTRPRSPHLHAFESGAGNFLLDVGSGALHPISPGHALLVRDALKAGDIARAELVAHAFGWATRAHPPAPAPRTVPVRALSLAVAHKCNLGCVYCYAQQGTFGKPAESMALDTACAAVDMLLAECAPGDNFTLAFMGGEPLANRAVLHAVTRYAAGQAAAGKVSIGFSLTTNATLISPADIALFQEFEFMLTVSLDGMQDANDALRPLRSGKGSFKRIQRSVGLLLAQPDRRYTVLARVTVTPFNLHLTHTLAGLEDMGFDGITFSPMLSAPSGKAQMDAEDLDFLLDELIRCSDHFVAGLTAGRVIPFTNLITTLQRLHAYHQEAYPCGAGGGYLGVSASGGIYACHRFVDDEGGSMGHVSGGIDAGKRAVWLNARHLQQQSPCGGCWARYLCSGGCHYEAIKRGRPACDYIRGWLHHCLGLYTELATSQPRMLEQILAA